MIAFFATAWGGSVGPARREVEHHALSLEPGGEIFFQRDFYPPGLGSSKSRAHGKPNPKLQGKNKGFQSLHKGIPATLGPIKFDTAPKWVPFFMILVLKTPMYPHGQAPGFALHPPKLDANQF